MENYVRTRVEEQPPPCPFTGLGPDTPEVRVRDGSKIRNLLRFALSRLEAEPRPGSEEDPVQPGDPPVPARPPAEARPPCSHLVFTASGRGVSKAVTCAEIVKRRVKGLHQLTRVQYGTVVEVWDPLEPAGTGAGLDSLTVRRNQPTVWILLSRDPLDRSQPGYQAPGRYDGLWAPGPGPGPGTGREEAGSAGPRPGHRRKRGGGGGRGKGPARPAGRPREALKGQN
ncbi:ribonuclease P protein subunit p25-like protein [Cololabis saira]|uniref:ribonuclease P protein subunit p25-like protein n=1 Tax=Cololabis saira TaxID=129043 RepID=UPI002AD1D16B|nr:ribonuclease P protein subunit p25-like protein [Cololabis saira]